MDHSTTVATSVAAKTRSSSFKRVIATALTAALAAGGLTVIAAAAPASAAVTDSVSDATLTWGLQATAAGWGVTTSGNVDLMNPTTVPEVPADPNATPPAGGTPSYVKAPSFTLTDGTGSISPAGTGTLSFDGSVTYSPFAAYGSLTYPSSFTFANFELETTPTSRGTLTADVTWKKETTEKTEATNVTLANFDIASATVADGKFNLVTEAPDWANTVPAGTYNAYTDAWPTSLVNALMPLAGNSDIPVYFYRTSTSPGNNNKAPLPITVAATTARPEVANTIVSQSHAGGFVFSAVGDGFRWRTSATGTPPDAGIYLGVAESGGDNSYADVGSYAAAVALFGEAMIPNGTFTRTVTVPTSKLDPAKKYSLYTWQAHTHSNTTQDTETPLDIDFDALERYTSTVTATAPTTVAFGSPAIVSAAITGADTTATGSVEFFNGETSVGSSDLVDGSASFPVPNLAVGTYSFTAKYSGDSHFTAGTAAVAPVTVERAQVGSVALKLTRTSAVYGAAVNARATVVGGTGTVAITVDDKQVGTATLTAAGVATVRLPASLLVGAHSVTASYAGNDTVGPKDSAPITLRIVKATTAKVTVSGAKYKKNTAPTVTVKVAKLNNGGWAHGTVKVYIGSKVVKSVKITTANKGTIKVTLPKQTKSSIAVKAAYSGTTTINAKNSSTVRIKRK